MAVAPARSESRYGVLAVAVLCVSVGSIFVRLASAPPLAVAFYRIGLATVIVAPFAVGAAARALPALSARHRLVVAASGIALGLHFATWIASLSYTSVAASVLLVNTAPLFTLAFSRLVLGEAVSPAVAVAMAVALAGAA
jgi:drug/metabolite transporter (DMT)-like permease